MTSGIYAILNIVTEKYYIGSAVDFKYRWQLHKARLNNKDHRNQYLQNAFNKYGKENFIFVVIEYVEDKNLNKPLTDILIENSNYQSNKLRIKLLKYGIKEHKCENCNNTLWMGKLIPLELEHINGKNNDNRLENLKLLCPNCHALTDSYRGKNWGKANNKHHYSKPV